MSLGDVRMRRVDSQLINMPDNVAMRHRTESGMVLDTKFITVMNETAYKT